MKAARSSPLDAVGQLPFRDRGRDVSRIEGLSDAVIGFAITLAVVSLEVPRTSDDLILLVRGLGSFGLTFGILFSVWWTQHKFFRRYGLTDDTTIWITGVLLFVVVFYTYPLKFLMASTIDPLFGLPSTVLDAAGVARPVTRKEHVGIVFAMYGLGYGLICTMFWLLYRHAFSKREALGLDEGERLETRLTQELWRNSIFFSLIFFGFLPVPMLPRQSMERKTYLLAYFAVLLITAGWYTYHVLRMRRERLAFIAHSTTPPLSAERAS